MNYFILYIDQRHFYSPDNGLGKSSASLTVNDDFLSMISAKPMIADVNVGMNDALVPVNDASFTGISAHPSVIDGTLS